jgi:hypothetical protein
MNDAPPSGMTIIPWDGQPISKPGWYSGIPIERYHSAGMCDGPAVSSTNLRTCWSKSPKHMFAQWCENPKAEPKKSTRPMILGQAAHHLFLGEDDFGQKFIAQPEYYPDRKTGELKPWHNGSDFCKAWNLKYAKKVIVTVKEFEAIVDMSESLRLNPMVDDGALNGHIECSGFFKHELTGLWVKVRPDVIPALTGDFVDLKTASEVTTPALQYTMREYGYHQQGGLIWETCDALGTPFTEFTLMFIETSAPFCARDIAVTPEDMARGRKQNLWALRAIKGCIDNDHWWGPGEGDPRPLPLANDERARIDARLKAEGIA